jgi:sugar phosphate isomerase/epimerase
VINRPGGLSAIDAVIAYDDPYGAWLWVPDDVDARLEEYDYTPAGTDCSDDAAGSRASTDAEAISDIERLWRYARRLGCDYIRLDADADVDPQLPKYEW